MYLFFNYFPFPHNVATFVYPVIWYMLQHIFKIKITLLVCLMYLPFRNIILQEIYNLNSSGQEYTYLHIHCTYISIYKAIVIYKAHFENEYF